MHVQCGGWVINKWAIQDGFGYAQITVWCTVPVFRNVAVETYSSAAHHKFPEVWVRLLMRCLISLNSHTMLLAATLAHLHLVASYGSCYLWRPWHPCAVPRVQLCMSLRASWTRVRRTWDDMCTNIRISVQNLQLACILRVLYDDYPRELTSCQ